MHFSGLLSFSVTHGLDFLAKASISLIMALMRLFIFEEGDLIALGSLMALPVQPVSFEISSHKAGEVKLPYILMKLNGFEFIFHV